MVHDRCMQRFRARAEFRRQARRASWVLAGVTLDHHWWPARPGVEPIHARLPESGLVAWADLPTPVIAADEPAAAAIALDVARATWAQSNFEDVPFAAGTAP